MLLVSCLLIQCENSNGESAQIVDDDNAQKTKHLFILAGQSNMEGLDPDISFIPAVSKEFGIENIGVVKYAVSGSPIRRWFSQWQYPDSLNDNIYVEYTDQSAQKQGGLYEILMGKVNNAISDNKIESATLIWMQGERDARLGYADSYENALTGLYENVCKDLNRTDIFFIIGRLSDWDEAATKYPDWQKIRDIQVKVAESNPLFDWVNTDDLNDLPNGTNDLHFTYEGYRIFGERIAQKAIHFINQYNNKMINTLTRQEKDEGWQLLFDGSSLDNWKIFNDGKVMGWKVKDGVLYNSGVGSDHGGDIITDAKFSDFILELEWKISEKSNSGIFYHVEEGLTDAIYQSGPEYQLLDDKGWPTPLNPDQYTGANYAMHAPINSKVKPTGQWNHTKIVVKGAHVEHWLNGSKVVKYQLWNNDWEARKNKSKWKDEPYYGKAEEGHIGLQDHGGLTMFRNIKLKKL